MPLTIRHFKKVRAPLLLMFLNTSGMETAHCDYCKVKERFVEVHIMLCSASKLSLTAVLIRSAGIFHLLLKLQVAREVQQILM